MLYQDQFYLLGLIVLMPLIGAIINGVLGPKLPRRLVDLIGCGSILTSFLLSLVSIKALVANASTLEGETLYGELTYTAYQWIYAGDFGADIAFMLDPLTALLLLLITGVGFLIHLYSVGYMEHDPAKWRYFSYLNLFCFSMLLLVMGKNMLVTFIGWEGVGLCSYLLIGFWYTDDENAKAGQKAFIVNRVGDAAFLLGMFILFFETGTLDYLELETWATSYGRLATLAPVAGVVASLIFIGCTGKSAQIPLFVWLPDAMAGPTPVSALIHAATMVTGGRLSDRAAQLAVYGQLRGDDGGRLGRGAHRALRGHDRHRPKRHQEGAGVLHGLPTRVHVLGRGRGQLHRRGAASDDARLLQGAVVFGLGQRHPRDERRAGHPQDGGAAQYMPWTAGTFFVACLAISGSRSSAGFFSKDLILWGSLSNVHIFSVDGVLGSGQSVLGMLTTTKASAPIQPSAALDIVTGGEDHHGGHFRHRIDHRGSDCVLHVPPLLHDLRGGVPRRRRRQGALA